MPVTDLSQPAKGARVVNLARSDRGERVISGLATIARVAGTIAAGAGAAHAFASGTKAARAPKKGGK